MFNFIFRIFHLFQFLPFHPRFIRRQKLHFSREFFPTNMHAYSKPENFELLGFDNFMMREIVIYI